MTPTEPVSCLSLAVDDGKHRRLRRRAVARVVVNIVTSPWRWGDEREPTAVAAATLLIGGIATVSTALVAVCFSGTRDFSGCLKILAGEAVFMSPWIGRAVVAGAKHGATKLREAVDVAVAAEVCRMEEAERRQLADRNPR